MNIHVLKIPNIVLWCTKVFIFCKIQFISFSICYLDFYIMSKNKLINTRFIFSFTNSVIIVPYLHYLSTFSCFPYRIKESFFLSFQCVSTIVQLSTIIFSPSNAFISLVENKLTIEFMTHLWTVLCSYA